MCNYWPDIQYVSNPLTLCSMLRGRGIFNHWQHLIKGDHIVVSQSSCVHVCLYRCSLMGFDLNRHWQDPSPWAQPTLHAVKQLIVQMNQDPVSEEACKHAHAHAQAQMSSIRCSTFLHNSNVCWSFSASVL